MTETQIANHDTHAQAIHGAKPHPTPVEIRLAISEALLADQDDPSTPDVPVHVARLIREAITRACDGGVA